ncbi:MAG: GAF domain-containing protein [Kouleothrix sp.]|jgi:two-component system NtrC family sensor kinase|nr:GAF domain-containing protein [Kouleothrix sp.]
MAEQLPLPKNRERVCTQAQLRRHRREARLHALEQRVAELSLQVAAGRARRDVALSQRLDTLLAVCAALLVTHDRDAVVQLVVEQAIALFNGASGAVLFLSDPAEQSLVLRAVSSGSLSPQQLAPGQTPAGRAYLAPRAMLMVGPELEQALAELVPAQQAELAQMFSPWPPSSALLAPLRIEGRRLGALVVYGGTQAHLFIPRDLPFIQALADLAAVAIAETSERERVSRLQHALAQTQSRQAETQARLDAAQAQLLQSAKLAAVGELAASVAHEINNPLYAARNSLILVEQDLAADAPQRPFLEIAQTELGRIARIITRMRDFYRPTRAELEPTCLDEVLIGTIELVHTYLRHGHIEIRKQLSGQLPRISAHADQMRQVFLNLMLNACDAMPAGGALVVSSQLVLTDPVQPAMIEVQISDTGVGVAPEHLAHLFEPFYTTKPQGTGLGLAITAHIITQHGGQISVASTLGCGTTFTICLPLEHPNSAFNAADE